MSNKLQIVQTGRHAVLVKDTTTTHVSAAKEGDDDLHSFIKPPVEPQ